MTLLFLLACAGEPDATDSGAASTDTTDTDTDTDTNPDTDGGTGTDGGGDTGGGDTGDTAPDLAPSIDVDVDLLGAAVGDELTLTVAVDDEDPDSVVLTADLDQALATGAFDGTTWTATADGHGVTTLTVTATDGGGQTDAVEVPLHVWVPRTWSGWMPLQSPDEDWPGAEVTLTQDGWTYLSGWSGTLGMMMALGTTGMEWSHTFPGDTEYPRSTAVDESTGHAVYVAESYPEGRGLIRGVDASGQVWESWAPFLSSTAYWADARDGRVAVAGTYSDGDTDTRGGWVQFFDTATGDLIDAPILLGTHPRSFRTEPSSVQVREDGSVLAASWGYWDWDADEASDATSGWVQIASPGDVQPEPVVVLAADDGDVFLADAVALPDGRFAVTGNTTGTLYAAPSGDADGFLAVYEADGTLVWGTQYQDRTTSRFAKLDVGHDGQLYVVGDAGYFMGWVGVLAYEPDGTLAWETSVIDGAHSVARGIAVRGTDIVVTAAFQGSIPDTGITSAGATDGLVLRLTTDGVIQD